MGITVLYSFAGQPDGSTPYSGVTLDKKGDIFGTTFAGGQNSVGTVFELTRAGSGYSERLVHSFTGTDGSSPVANPLIASDGRIYVTSIAGGQYGAGTAIELAPSGGQYSEMTAYSFGSGSDGASPNSGFLQVGSTLYATTASGGKYGYGAIVAMDTTNFAESDVYDFKDGSDGAFPLSGLIPDSSGALYGTTVGGGSAGKGTVYKFVPAKGGGAETVLWSFQGSSDGTGPNGGVVIDSSGDIYGTTPTGGNSNSGVVFELKPGKGGYQETILHAFAGGADGAQPVAGLTLSGKLLYGATSSGSGSLCVGCGTLFRMKTAGTGYEVLHTFQGAEGANPLGNLYVTGSSIYGTTSTGGANNVGVVFKFEI
jgi:uncharacterized repeat protein (TIGR03803 family)